MTLEEWADMLDGAERVEGMRPRSRVVVIPDDLARQLADHLRAAADLLDDEPTLEHDEN